jgi:hypothetical protein
MSRQQNAGQNHNTGSSRIKQFKVAQFQTTNVEEVKKLKCQHFLNVPRNFRCENEI